MKRKRFKEEQIIQILKEAEAGATVRSLCRKYGMSEQTFYRWKSKYGGLEVSDAKKLRALEDENRRLKKRSPTRRSTCRCSRMCWEKTGKARPAS